MKRMKLLLFLVLLTAPLCFSQNIILSNINVPGEVSIGVINGAILGENLIGPRKILFSGNPMTLQKEEAGKRSLGFGVEAASIDKLATLYSGRIFSPGIIEPFVFENKTPEELVLFEVIVSPTGLGQPYTLYIDLVVQASSKPVSADQSNDAGEYTAKIFVNLIEI